MRSILRVILPMVLCALALSGAHTASGQQKLIIRKRFHTMNGIVVMGHAVLTHARLLDANGNVIKTGEIPNNDVTKLPLPEGNYTLEADDDITIVANDTSHYDQQSTSEIIKQDEKGAPAHRSVVRFGNTGVSVTPVPYVGDASYANNPPNFVSRHVVFLGVPTRLKAVIKGGTAPYTVTWDPGDGAGPQPAFTANDDTVSGHGVTYHASYNGAAMFYTYNANANTGFGIGTPFTATITVRDSTGATTTGSYYGIVGSPSSRANRIARATDEGLWWLHTVMQPYRYDGYVRHNNYTGKDEPPTDLGYIYNNGTGGSYYIAPSSMFAICLENTGRSITGGKNYSNDPVKDPYVEDLNRLINMMTDPVVLIATATQNKTYQHSGLFNPDTHPVNTNGTKGNGTVAYSAGSPIYEGGMQLQAISQAGYADGPVPNRTEYASYYDLIGDFVDGFQATQGYAGGAEGGWRYSFGFNYNDSDGSAVAWACIGLLAAQLANTNTPGTPQHSPIVVDPVVLTELGIWLNYDQSGLNDGTFQSYDYRTKGYFQTHYDGGMGYGGRNSGTNAGKTGGGLAALKLIGKADTASTVLSGISYLYRNFYAYDPLFNWSSARDSYGMYNMFKGLTETHVTKLTDPLATDSNDLDGRPLIYGGIDWYAQLADYIAGTGLTINNASNTPYLDLGHQKWPGNLISYYFSNTNDGHFESTGVRNFPVPPLTSAEWGEGSSDGSAASSLITTWDLAILQGTVFTPPPVAVIAHPDPNANENYIPISVNGNVYNAIFDPSGSFELNPDPSVKIVHIHWDFGDGATDDYDLNPPVTPVPFAPGIHPMGNQSQHSYSVKGDYTVTLTITDTAGNSASANVIVHVIPAPFPPVAKLGVTTGSGYPQNGATVGVDANGYVTLNIDASASFNPDPDSVQAPKNSNGISTFAFQWPVAAGGTTTSDPVSPYNAGSSPQGFNQGVADGTLPNSKAATQTYRFHFDPNSLPGGILIGLQVTSNIANVGVPNKATIYQTINIKHDYDVSQGPLTITGVNVQNITATSAVVSFTTNLASNATVNYSTDAYYKANPGSPYNGSATDGKPANAHNVTLTGLTAGTTYHFNIVVSTPSTTNPLNAKTGDAAFTTQPAGKPALSLTVQSHSYSNGVETVVYKLTNTGSGTASSISVTGLLSDQTTVTPATTTPISVGDIAMGASNTFTVKWNVPNNGTAPTLTGFKSKVTYGFKDAAANAYSGSAVSSVVVP